MPSKPEDHAQSIADTVKDYRAGEIAPITAAHVIEWAGQFDKGVRAKLLAELNHVLKQTYVSAAVAEARIRDVVRDKQRHIVGTQSPAAFWKTVGFLNIQQGGASQAHMLTLMDGVLKAECGYGIAQCAPSSGEYLYLDDAIFSGTRARVDIAKWLRGGVSGLKKLHILALSVHAGGEYYANKVTKEILRELKVDAQVKWWTFRSVEDRRTYINESQVLRPASIPADAETLAYVKHLSDAGFAPVIRNAAATRLVEPFSSAEGRDLLEQEFLRAGVRIRKMCPLLPETCRPLGYSVLKTLGFGSLIVTYRNCPNNAPLALWAGDPWLPLFERRTN